jgi:predicted enzyme related to lactoylglutathione lyase
MAAEIVHLEFKSASFARTTEFYAQLFDWRTEQNASGSYMKLSGDGAPSAGWVRADLVQAPGPIPYLAVDDLPAKLQEIERAGGRVLVPSLPFAGGGEVGLFADPDGNILGLWHRKAGGAGATPTATTTTTTTTTAKVAAAKPVGKPSAKPATPGKAPAAAKEPAKKPAKKK